MVHWVPPIVGVLKFNVGGVAMGKHGQAGLMRRRCLLS